jgi:hypothetical protein
MGQANSAMIEANPSKGWKLNQTGGSLEIGFEE